MEQKSSVPTTRLALIATLPYCLRMTCTITTLSRLLLRSFPAFPSPFHKQVSTFKAFTLHTPSCYAQQTTTLQARFYTIPRHERPSSIPPQLQRTTTPSDPNIEASQQNGFNNETRIHTGASASTKQRRDLQTGVLALHGLCDSRDTHRHGGIGRYSSLGSAASMRFLGTTSQGQLLTTI